MIRSKTWLAALATLGWASLASAEPNPSNLPTALAIPVAAADPVATTANPPTVNCAEPCCQQDCRAGCYGGLEVPILKAYQSEGLFGNFDHEAGIRLWAGYQRGDGLGVRVRWFDYDQTAGVAAAPFDETQLSSSIQVTTLDFEVADTQRLNDYWTMTLAGGLRYMHFKESAVFSEDFGKGLEVDLFAAHFDGVGPVASLELNRIVNSGVGLYGLARGSVLVDNDALYIERGTFFNNTHAHQDLTALVAEIQLGVQVHRSMGSSVLFGRAAWEAQFIDSISDDDSESVSLLGISFSVGIQR